MDYDEIIASAFIHYGLSKEEFLNMSPKEYALLGRIYYEDKLDEAKSVWERTRLQIYYNMEFKNPIKYKDFCKQYIPLSWDENIEPYEITEELKNQVFSDMVPPIKTEEVTDLSQLKGIL